MRLGKYELEKELGRGAYGTVYLARDTVLDVERALKVLHPAMLADEVLLERFRREARLAARLEHPHIVTVYDFGEDQGRFYIAMRYMAGGSLKARLEAEGPLPWNEVVRIVKQVAEGLAYAHEQGVVHRDLKPGNILFDERGNAAIGDFGFAKALSGAGGSLSLTATGGMVGTPPYMAPELWKNKGVGPAVDQYALACIVAEMLTGKVLFAGETPPEVMTKHVLEEPPLPEVWPEGVPEGVEEVLRKALAKEPDGRYEDITTFVVALVRERSKPRFALFASRTFSPKDVQQMTLVRTLKGHGERVSDVAFSPDGVLLASASRDGKIRLWRVADGALLRIMEKHKGGASSVAFAPSGLLLASGGNDKMVRLWRADTGELMRTLAGHNGPVNDVAFSPGGDLLASAATDYTVRLWRVDTGETIRLLKGHTSWVSSVAFSPDGAFLASAAVDGTMLLWQIPSGTLLRSLEGHEKLVLSVAFAPNGKVLASGAWDRTVRLWRVADGTLLFTLRGHQGDVNSVTFSPTGDLLASGSWDRTIRLWQTSNGAMLHTLKGHESEVFGVAFSPDGQWLASGSGDLVYLWKMP